MKQFLTRLNSEEIFWLIYIFAIAILTLVAVVMIAIDSFTPVKGVVIGKEFVEAHTVQKRKPLLVFPLLSTYSKQEVPDQYKIKVKDFQSKSEKEIIISQEKFNGILIGDTYEKTPQD